MPGSDSLPPAKLVTRTASRKRAATVARPHQGVRQPSSGKTHKKSSPHAPARSLQRAGQWWLLFLAAAAAPYYIADWAGVFISYSHLARLSSDAVRFPTTHPIHIPSPGNLTSYHAADASLIAWQSDMRALYGHVESMAVLSAGGAEGISFDFEGGGQGAGFVLQRDMSITIFMAVAGAVYLTDYIPLAAFVFHANAYALLVCMQVKKMNDIIQVLAGDLQSYQQQLILLPLGAAPEEVSAQLALMNKLELMAECWQQSSLGITLVVPLLHSLTISISIILSIVGATSARCIQVVLYGFYPRLPSLATLVTWASHHLAARTASLGHLQAQHRVAEQHLAAMGSLRAHPGGEQPVGSSGAAPAGPGRSTGL